MLELKQASLLRHGKTILDQVSMQAYPGELCVILGPNGAGKSTLLQLLSGYRQPDQGEARLAGQRLSGQSPAQLASQRAVVEQQTSAPAGWRADELIASGGYLAAADLLPAAMQQAVMLSDSGTLLGRRADSLSGGEIQRVHLARALCQLLVSSRAERYLLLDEATSALDLAVADAMMARLRIIARELQIGVLAVMHDLNLALRHADQVVLLRDGQCLASGRTADIMQQQQLEAIYGVALAELISPDTQVRAFVPRTSD